MFIKTEEKRFVLPAITEYLFMQSIISNCCCSTINHNLFPVFAALMPHCRNALGAVTQICSALKNSSSERRKLDIWESQDSFWGAHWKCQDKYCMIVTGYCTPILFSSTQCPQLVLFLWFGFEAGKGWRSCTGLLQFFLSAALGRKFHFYSLSLFPETNFLLPGVPPENSWNLLGAQMPESGLLPHTISDYLEQTEKLRIWEISGNCTKPRSYRSPVSMTYFNCLSKF